VSRAKFEALAASLLARKGDAAPSVLVPIAAPPRRAMIPRDDRPLRPEPPPLPFEVRQPDQRDKLRRIVISITHEDLERLCIAAVKKGAPRQEIVRDALHDYLRKLSSEFAQPCACIEAESCRSGTGCSDLTSSSSLRTLPASGGACPELDWMEKHWPGLFGTPGAD
jgi:hypothetical protein